MDHPVADDNPGSLTSPPKVSLVFRVGVVGHRPNRLVSADLPLLGTRIREILNAVRVEVDECFEADRELYNGQPAMVRALSPLAEGADRIFAQQALDEGFELNAVLPFAQHEFANDFQPQADGLSDSIIQFRGLLGQAKRVFTLDGFRSEASRAYRTAGDVVLNQSDLLIVVWDGERTSQRGGTEETLDDAINSGIPVVWIDAHAPHHWSIVTKPIHRKNKADEIPSEPPHSATLTALRQQVRRLVELPESDDHFNLNADSHHSHALSDDPESALRDYYNEHQARLNLAFWWRIFRDLVGDFRFRWPTLVVVPYEESELSNWPRDTQTPVALTVNRLRPYFSWADKLADKYADGYRSAFVSAFLIAAFSVAMALGAIGMGIADQPRTSNHTRSTSDTDKTEKPHSDHVELAEFVRGETPFAIGELLAMLLILFIVFRGRSGEWHRKWLDYRLLAEILRHQRLVVLLGGQRASPQVPEHLKSYGDPGASWMGWYARAVERALRLPTAIVDREYLKVCLQDLHDQLTGPNGQIPFHRATSRRSARIDNRLHRAESFLLVLTLVCCGLHILHNVHYIPGHLLTFCCGFFPALGAALAGIRNQGEFRRISQRSRSMERRLEKQLEKVRELQHLLDAEGELPWQLSAEIAAVAGETARFMVNEVLGWRVIFQDQPLKAS